MLTFSPFYVIKNLHMLHPFDGSQRLPILTDATSFCDGVGLDFQQLSRFMTNDNAIKHHV